MEQLCILCCTNFSFHKQSASLDLLLLCLTFLSDCSNFLCENFSTWKKCKMFREKLGYSHCCLCLFSEESFYRKQQTVPFFSICRIICIDNIGLLWSLLIKCEKKRFATAVTTFFFFHFEWIHDCVWNLLYVLSHSLFLFCIVFYAFFSLWFSFKWVVHMEFDQSGIRSVDLGGFFANADANYLGQEQGRGYYNTNNIQNAVVDIDPMDMSESMQEAMHRSNLDMRYTWVCSWIAAYIFGIWYA